MRCVWAASDGVVRTGTGTDSHPCAQADVSSAEARVLCQGVAGVVVSPSNPRAAERLAQLTANVAV